MPKGRGRKGGVAPRVHKPSHAVTTRIEMNIPETSSTNHIASAPMSDIHTVPPPQSQLHPNSVLPQIIFIAVIVIIIGGVSVVLFKRYCTVPFSYSLHIIGGNISTCFGCKNKYKSLKPPNDLCIKTP